MNLGTAIIIQIVCAVGIYLTISLRIDKKLAAAETIEIMESLIKSLNRYADKNLSLFEQKIREFRELEEEIRLLRKKIHKEKLLPDAKEMSQTPRSAPEDSLSPATPARSASPKLLRQEEDAPASAPGRRPTRGYGQSAYDETAIINRLVESEKTSFQSMSVLEKVHYLTARKHKEKEIAERLHISLSEVKLYLHMRNNHETGYRN